MPVDDDPRPESMGDHPDLPPLQEGPTEPEPGGPEPDPDHPDHLGDDA